MSLVTLGCAACFGDPDSALTKGALAGVLVLIGVVGAVLGGVVFLISFWMKRARALEVAAEGPVPPATARLHDVAPWPPVTHPS